jgi:glycosyltransferase involved in cell wall biosynthesis
VGRPIAGGIEAVSSALVCALQRLDDVELHVVTVAAGKPLAARHVDQPPLHVLVSSGRWQRPTLYLRERAAIARCLRELRPDVVHVQGQNFYALGALSAGLPTLVTLHGMLAREARIVDPRSRWTERLSKRVRGYVNATFEAKTLRRAAQIVVISPYVAECIAGRTRARLHAIDNPIDDEYFTVPDEQQHTGRLLFAGALEPRKGVHHLIEAMRLLRIRGVRATLVVAGATVDQGYAAALRRATVEGGLGQDVQFLGLIDQERLYREYAQASLVVMASREETSPMLVQQAMAAGRAVVAPRVGGIPHLIEDGVTGLLVTPEDPHAIAGAVSALLGDAESRRRMGAAARERAEHRFRAAAVAARTRDVYLELRRPAARRAVTPSLAAGRRS